VVNRETKIDLEHGDAIEAAADRFGDHEQMSHRRVLKWLAQFSDDHLPIAIKILKKIRYYNAGNLRALCRQLATMIADSLPVAEYPAVAVVPVGNPGSGASIVARLLRDHLDRTHFHLVDLLKVAKAKPGDYSAVVFIEDFSGTGRTLSKWWASVEPIVRPLDADLVWGVLVLNYRARSVVEELAPKLVYVEEIDESSDLFDAACNLLTEEEKTVLLAYSKKTGCRDTYERGYGGCGLAMSFKHGCPNNSIPTLWHDNSGWQALFIRRAV